MGWQRDPAKNLVTGCRGRLYNTLQLRGSVNITDIFTVLKKVFKYYSFLTPKMENLLLTVAALGK
jgi:hypothetical protein